MYMIGTGSASPQGMNTVKQISLDFRDFIFLGESSETRAEFPLAGPGPSPFK